MRISGILCGSSCFLETTVAMLGPKLMNFEPLFIADGKTLFIADGGFKFSVLAIVDSRLLNVSSSVEFWID